MRDSQTARIRAVLEEGRWVTTAELHRRCGFSRLNSRCAEIRKALRREGRDLVCEYIGGKGPEAYRWRIVPLEAAAPFSGSAAASSGPAAEAIPQNDPLGTGPLVQLTLEAA